MKFVKSLLVLGLMLVLSGCFWNKEEVVENEEISKSYESMFVGRGGINGYTLDLRISGKIKGEVVNEIVRINNYQDTNFQITIIDTLAGENNEETFYIIDGKTYKSVGTGEYEEVTIDVRFSNPSVILEGLKNIAEDSEPVVETIAANEYSVYEVVVKKEIVDEILEMGRINLIPEEDVTAKIYINEDGYVYRIIYSLDELTLNASYFGIDNAREIHLPDNDME